MEVCERRASSITQLSGRSVILDRCKGRTALSVAVPVLTTKLRHTVEVFAEVGSGVCRVDGGGHPSGKAARSQAETRAAGRGPVLRTDTIVLRYESPRPGCWKRANEADLRLRDRTGMKADVVRLMEATESSTA